MNFKNICAVIVLSSILYSCQPPLPGQDNFSVSSTTSDVNHDNRAKDEIYFLNKVKNESDYEISSNAIEKDEHIKSFNKYAIDSLKKIDGWEMIVNEINDNPYSSNSFSKALLDLDNNPVYNISLVAPIKIDKSVDSIAINNRVDFTATIFKNPKTPQQKTQIEAIRKLKKGDTVIVAGGLTHIDENLKPNFAAFYDEMGPWNLDLLITDIKKKGVK